MYKEASRQKLRFSTSRGSLSVEQLWGLSLDDLDALAVSLQEAYNNSKGKSFLDKRTTKDKGLKLQFDIVFDVLQSLSEEQANLRKQMEDKEHNKKILGIIADKQEDALKSKSIKELEKELRY